MRPLPGPGRQVTIAGSLHGGNALLALPTGVARVQNLPALGVATNWFGSVRVEDGPGFVQFEAEYGGALGGQVRAR